MIHKIVKILGLAIFGLTIAQAAQTADELKIDNLSLVEENTKLREDFKDCQAAKESYTTNYSQCTDEIVII